jgi:hypothetical protein
VGSASTRTEELSRPATEALGGRADHRLALTEHEDESMDYERLCETSQAMIHAVMSRLMLMRLARA